MCRNVIWSDEKRFCLDGPDGLHSHWADMCLPRRIFSRTQREGGGLMIWASFSAKGKSKLVFVEGNLNAAAYTNMLEDTMISLLSEYHSERAIYQHDNAPAHSPNHTTEFLMDCEFEVMEWPARSPYLNPIENLWAGLVRDIYDAIRQFYELDDLKEAILYAWENIDDELLRNLAFTMAARCANVIEKRGGAVAY